MLPLIQSLARLGSGSLGFVGSIGAVVLRVTLVLTLGLAASLIIRRQSASRRHFVLVLTAVAALFVPLLAAFAPRWEIHVLPDLPRVSDASLSSVVRPSVAPSPDALASSLKRRDRSAAALRVASSDNVTSIVSPSESALHSSRALSPAVIAFSLWLAGALVMLGHLSLGIVRRTRLARSASPHLPAAWDRARARLLARADLSARVTYLVTSRSSMPMTWGVLRPVILLPIDCSWSTEERDAALLHEMAHVRRLDALWLPLLALVRILHWYNPLAWWLSSAERLTREEACDDLVLRAGVRPSTYAEQLLGIVQRSESHRLPLAALAMARPAALTRRLRAVLRAEQRRDVPGNAMRVGSIVSVALLGACIGTASPVARTSSTSSGVARSAPVERALADFDATARSTHLPEVRADSAQHSLSTSASASAASAGSASGDAVSPSVAQVSADVHDVNALAPAQEQCAGRPSSRSSASSRSIDDESRQTISWSRNGCKIELSSAGEYTLSATLDDVRSISRGGFLTLREYDGKVDREVRITPSSGGALDHLYRVDGEKRPWDADAMAWFARVALTLDRRVAWAVDVRFPVLMQRGGVDAVIAEIDLMEGDYARRVYFTKLATSAQLTSAQLVRVLDSAGAKIESDYERAELLIAAGKQRSFDDAAQLALARAAGGIKSAYEKRRAFSVLLKKDGLSPATVGAILTGTRGMDSDYELAELLIDVSKKYAIDPGTRRYYLDALGTIDSDYEYRRVLTALTSRGPLPPEYTATILEHAAAHMRGYELAELLLSMNKSVAADRTLGLALVAAARKLDSDYEHSRVLKGMVAQRPDTAVVEQIIKDSRTVGSGYEQAELLLVVASAYRMNGRLREAYLEAAQGIDSDYERGRALAGMKR